MHSAQMTRTLSFKVDDELNARLEAFQAQQEFDVAKSKIIRKALEDYLDEHMDPVDS